MIGQGQDQQALKRQQTKSEFVSDWQQQEKQREIAKKKERELRIQEDRKTDLEYNPFGRVQDQPVQRARFTGA
jgi:hypothetical protein